LGEFHAPSSIPNFKKLHSNQKQSSVQIQNKTRVA